ncbi:MAG: 3-phosphoshikimate 1-carboxyvinyltransferase [Dehalococcoidales bacterium]|nr:3-phosphoshikimate 1-carboxyvinyltransferase [Dehalococcoidales bacterium]
MKVTVGKSELQGTVSVPASKSLTIRVLICAALCRGDSLIENPLVSEDTEAALGVLRKLGIHVQQDGSTWQVTGGTFHAPEGELHCGESATTLRFITAICSLIPGTHRIVGGPSLTKRPVRTLVEALQKLGVNIEIERKTTPPVTVEGGLLEGGTTSLPGHISSQFISALMLIAPFAQNEVSIKLTTPLSSRPYVLMTLWTLKQFGVHVQAQIDRFIVPRGSYKPTNLTIEGDWSSASYFLALAAVSQGITVENLNMASLQGDRVILEYLRAMGVTARVKGTVVTISEKPLQAIHADLTDCIDLLPTMAVLAALANGKTELTGIARARIKESNRVAAVRQGLERLGIEVTEDRDRMTIVGIQTPKKAEGGYDDDDEEKPEETPSAEIPPVVINSFNDHRIAMAFGVLGAAIGGETINEVAYGKFIIEGAECVAKTFPDFWESMKSVGADITIDE